MANLAIAITIEGLGRTSTASTVTEPLRLSLWDGLLTSPSRYYYPALADWPDQIESTLDIIGGMTDRSSMGFRLGNIDSADDETADIRDFFLLSRPERQHKLRASYSATATTILGQKFPGAATIVVNQILWIGREAIRVDSISASTTDYSLGVTRGVFGTTAAPLVASRDFFYITSPTMLDRLLTVYVVDTEDSASESTIWRGVIDSSQLDGPMMDISINAVDLLSYVSDQPLGVGRVSGSGGIRLNGDSDSSVDFLFARSSPTSYLPTIYDVIHVSVDDMLVRAGKVSYEDTDANGVPQFHVIYTNTLITSEVLSPNIDISYNNDAYIGKPSAEVLLADTTDDLSLFRNEQNTTQAGGQSSHPLDIIRNILTSTGETTFDAVGFPTNPHRLGSNGDFDSLPGAWGLSFPDAFIDHTTFDALKLRYPYQGLTANNFVLGSKPGDDLQKAAEVVKKLAAAAGCYLYVKSNGLIACGALSSPTLAAVDASIGAAELDPDGLEDVEVRPADIGPVQRVTLEMARVGLSDTHAVKFIGKDFSGELDERYKRQARSDEVDGGHYGDPRTATVPPGLLTTVAACVERRFVILADYLPQYTLKLRHDAISVLAGQWIALTHPAIPSPIDGTRGITNNRCLVVRSQRDLSTAHLSGSDIAAGQELTVINYAPVTLANDLVLPSWLISGVTSDTIFELSEGAMGGDGTLPDTGLWRDASDGDYFVSLWSEDGILRSTDGPEVGNISGSTVTLTSAWQAGAVDVTPVVGDIIRVADYDAAGDWLALHDYVWIADINATLGAGAAAAARWDV